MKTFAPSLSTYPDPIMNPTQLHSLALLAGRVLMAAIFILSGLGKLSAQEPTQGYMQAMGVPGALLWPTIAFEVIAGLLVVVGYQTRIVALLLAGFCLVSGAIFHHNFADQIQMVMFLKNVSMAGGLLVLATTGAGRFALDKRA
jgi:putative oxidoreductase